MKTGRVFSQLRLEFLIKKLSEEKHLLSNLETELIDIVYKIKPLFNTFQENNIYQLQGMAKRAEIKKAEKSIEKIENEVKNYTEIIKRKFGIDRGIY